MVFLFLVVIGNAQTNMSINPYVDTLGLARYPLTDTLVLHAIAEATISSFHGEKSDQIIDALILNPNTADITLNTIAFFLSSKEVINQDRMLALASHKNSSKKTINNILIYTEGKSGLDLLNAYCNTILFK